ncbi:MAG: VanW family protein [Deltaproteobacteria bacterium]
MRWLITLLAICLIPLICPPALGIEEMVGDYKIPLSLAASPQNASNALLAASFLNGTVVQPGKKFSFNQTIGPRSAKRGFIMGLVSNKDKYTTDWGGGVCMTSSTLHQAVKDAGLTVLERHDHQQRSRYLPLGEDAAVSFGVEDFRFRNGTAYPILIKAGEDDKALFVSLWALRPDARIKVNGIATGEKIYVETEEGKAIVPVRAITKSLGAELAWNPSMRRAIIVKGQDIIELQVDSSQAFIDGDPVLLGTRPGIRNGTLALPLDDLADIMDFKANWDQAGQTISITFVPDNAPRSR